MRIKMTVNIYDSEKEVFVGSYDDIFGVEIIKENVHILDSEYGILKTIILKPTEFVRVDG